MKIYFENSYILTYISKYLMLTTAQCTQYSLYISFEKDESTLVKSLKFNSLGKSRKKPAQVTNK
jgi:hypothetical protein